MPKNGEEPKFRDAAMRAVSFSSARLEASVRSPLPESHPIYADIGRVAAQWAQLEHILDLTIWDLASIAPERGACITGQVMGARPRFQAIIALCMSCNLKKQIIDSTRELMNKTLNVGEDRNRMVHDAWYMELPSGKTFQFRTMPRKNPTYGLNEIDHSKLVELIARIKRRVDSAYKLRSDILGEIQSSP